MNFKNINIKGLKREEIKMQTEERNLIISYTKSRISEEGGGVNNKNGFGPS